MQSLISVNDLSNEEIIFLLHKAEEIQNSPKKFANFAKDKIIALLFFEPSTRTYFSFSAAMYRMGGNVLGFSQSEGTSAVKGETLEDTVRMLASYADMIIMRHAEVGSMQRIAQLIDIPLINAGEGTGEHPTQTLNDLFTIYKNLRRLDVTITLCGDLKYGRTNHSLILAASRFGANFICIAPEALQMPEKYIAYAKKQGAKVILDTDINKYISDTDVLYMSRLQKERLPETVSKQLTAELTLNESLLNKMKTSAIVLHPLPRTKEIDPAIDDNFRIKYFEQAGNAVAMRMAIILFYFNFFSENKN